MNKHERIKAALTGKAVDYIPASFWFHFPEKQQAGAAMAEAHLKYYRECDPDWLKVMNDTGYDLPGDFFNDDGTRNLEALATPTPLSSNCFQSFLDGYKSILDAVGDEVATIVTLFCPYATLNYATDHGADKTVREQPEAAEKALQGIAQSLAAFSQAVIETGAWGMYFSAQGGEAERLTPEEHARFVEPYDRMVLSAVSEAPFNLLHVCGEGLRMDPYWKYPAACINWAAGSEFGNPGIAAGRASTDMAIAAGIHNRGPITTGPEKAINEEVENALKEGGREKFLLAAGCTLPNDVDWKFIRAAREKCIRPDS